MMPLDEQIDELIATLAETGVPPKGQRMYFVDDGQQCYIELSDYIKYRGTNKSPPVHSNEGINNES